MPFIHRPQPLIQIKSEILAWPYKGERLLSLHRPIFMGIARIISAALIAVSVALLPAAGAAAFNLKSPDSTETSGVEPQHACCPPATDPCDMAVDGCGSMATCALKCFSFAAGLASPLTYGWTPASSLPLLESNGLHSQTGSPPFRPPRI